MIGRSPAMMELVRLIKRIGASEKPVLIEGESGTGKELVAHALRRSSPRANGCFVTVNCAALSETLLETELFGHVRGSFTGAYRDRVGVFEHLAKLGRERLDLERPHGDLSRL